MEKQKKQDSKTGKEQKIVETECKDSKCHIHGNLKARGRMFKGIVIKKFPKRVVIEFERMVYVRKYERYLKSRTKIHARLPECIEKNIQIGDYIKVQECRPLSKIVHFVVLSKVEETNSKEKIKSEVTLK